MKSLKYNIIINCPGAFVWNTMLDSEDYKKWASAFYPGSHYRGEWKQDSRIKFIDPCGGTLALLEEVTPYKRIRMKHIALINEAGSIDKESEDAKQWIGTTENYIFQEENGKTRLDIEMKGHEKYLDVLDECWLPAIEGIKKLCEEKTTRSIIISRMLDSPITKVWEAWTRPAYIEKWYGPGGFTTRVVQHDFKPGGKWHYVMNGPNNMENAVTEIFSEISREEKIITTSEHAITSLFFEPAGKKTNLTLVMILPSPEVKIKFEEMGVGFGWNSSFDRLEEYIKSAETITV